MSTSSDSPGSPQSGAPARVPVQACLMDAQGNVVWGNAAWREFIARQARQPGAPAAPSGLVGRGLVGRGELGPGELGAPLLACGGGHEHGSADTRHIEVELRRLLRGEIDFFDAEYNCVLTSPPMRFVMHAQSLTIDGRRCAFVLHEDVTRARQTEQMLREGEARYRQLFEGAPDAVFVLGAQEGERGLIFDANEQAAAMHGYARQDLIGMSIADLDEPEDAQRVAERIEELVRTGRIAFEAWHRRRDGSTFPVEVTARAATIDGRRVVLSFNRDISERRRAQQELQTQSVRLDIAARSSQVGFWDWDLGTDVVIYSPEWKAQLGYETHEIADRFDEWQTRCHPDDAESALATVAAHLRGELPHVAAEFRLRHRDGQYRWIYSRGQVIRNANGEPVRLVGCHVDITARKRAEIERATLATRMEHVQRIEAIGTLAGGIAHDFNNILTAITGNIELALQDAEDVGSVRTYLGEVRKSADRAKALVRQILAFGRNDPPERQTLAIGDLVAEAARLLRTTVPQSIAIEVGVDSNVGAVFVDPEQIKQVLVNLGTNAWHAIGSRGGRGGRVVLQVHQVTPVSTHESDRGRVCIVVTDDGVGMDPETQARIFEPFFTTKPGSLGTGLGLSVVHGIITNHGGTIEVHSELGRGSTFRLYLPAAAAPISDPAPTTLVVGTCSDRILLVDDEPALLRVMLRGLQRLGYRVTGFDRPAPALAAIEADSHAFDIVVTDYDMPGMEGLELTRRIREVRADLPVVLCSGFVRPETLLEADTVGIRRVVYKPFTAQDLGAVVSEVLRARAS